MIDHRIPMWIGNETLGYKSMNEHVFPMDVCARISGIFQTTFLLMVSTTLKIHRKDTAIVCDEIISRINFCHDFSFRDVAAGIHYFSLYDRFRGQSRINGGNPLPPP